MTEKNITSLLGSLLNYWVINMYVIIIIILIFSFPSIITFFPIRL